MLNSIITWVWQIYETQDTWTYVVMSQSHKNHPSLKKQGNIEQVRG